MMYFAVEQVGVERLEARSAVENDRGTGALRKLGAVHEAVLRTPFRRHGVLHDQNLWTILRANIYWYGKAVWTTRVH